MKIVKTVLLVKRTRKHRAVMLSSPNVLMSGVYRCKVSSLTSEAEAEAMMLVYSPVDEMEFIQRTVPESHVNVTCHVTGIYPLPNVKLTFGEYDLVQDHMEVTLNTFSYDVTIYKVVERASILQGGLFGCEASVPGTAYHVRQEASTCSCQTLHIKDRKRIWRKHLQLLAAADRDRIRKDE